MSLRRTCSAQLSSPTTKLTLEGNNLWYINVEKEEWKLDNFLDIHEIVAITRALVLCGSQDKVQVIAGHMLARGLLVHTLVSLLASNCRPEG